MDKKTVNRETIHGVSAEIADNFFKRAKGLIGRDGLNPGEGMLIPKCNAIHTFFMRFPIDATFLSATGEIVKTVRDIHPGNPMVFGGWRAAKVLETQSAASYARGLISEHIASGLYAGIVAANSDGGPIIAEGEQCIYVKGRPMTERSVCDLASVGKTFTASLCALLYADGKLDPDAPFTEYLTDHVLAKENCDITVRDLATHSGGFDNSKPYQVPDEAEFEAKLLSKRPVRKRGEQYEYACSNFIYLGRIVEKLTGLDLDTAARKMLWSPLGMTHTTWNPVEDDGNVIEFPESSYGGYPQRRRIGDHNDLACLYSKRPIGSGSSFSTVGDLRLFTSDLLHRRMFKKEYYDLLFTPCFEKDGVRRTFGWDMAAENSGTCMTTAMGFTEQAIAHSGWTGPAIVVDPGLGNAAVFLGNKTGEYTESKVGRMTVLAKLCGTVGDSRG